MLSGVTMLYTAIDYHKRYSVACTMTAAGTRMQEARIGIACFGSGYVL